MDWQHLLNPKRFGGTSIESEGLDPRTQYEKDIDRILFSGSFRRLSRKTQVHPMAANDHIHTRLTHSLETARVGRTLGKAIFPHVKDDLPDHIGEHDLGAIVEAACLAHDIGNPPFGHAGEKAMSRWFSSTNDWFQNVSDQELTDIRLFDGNAQGFRVITQLEKNLFSGGMQLTYATLGTFLKYPHTSQHLKDPSKPKFSVFLTESHVLDEVATELRMAPDDRGGYLRHPLAYLVEAADDICYGILDIEDAVELGIMTYVDAEQVLFEPLAPKGRDRLRAPEEARKMFRVNLARIRGPLFDAMVQAAVDGFVSLYPRIIDDKPCKGIFHSMGDHPAAKFIAHTKEIGEERIYVDKKKMEIELGSFAVFDILLSAFCGAANERAAKLLKDTDESWKSKTLMEFLGDHAPERTNAPTAVGWTHHTCHRRAIDFVAGMTDNYATYVSAQLGGRGFSGLQRP